VPAIAEFWEFANWRDIRTPLGHADQRALRPMAHRIEVALGARETIRKGLVEPFS